MTVSAEKYIRRQGKTVAFSGHRTEKLPSGAAFGVLVSEIDNVLRILCNNRIDTFINGGCYGFDLICAERVMRLKNNGASVKLVMAVPFLSQPMNFSEADRKLYDTALSHADETVVISRGYYPGIYAARNRFMVDNADIVVAYCVSESGGTRQTLAYAESTGVPVINISSSAAFTNKQSPRF